MVRKLNLDVLKKHSKCEGKWTKVNTKNSNENSMIDYATCSNIYIKTL